MKQDFKNHKEFSRELAFIEFFNALNESVANVEGDKKYYP